MGFFWEQEKKGAGYGAPGKGKTFFNRRGGRLVADKARPKQNKSTDRPGNRGPGLVEGRPRSPRLPKKGKSDPGAILRVPGSLKSNLDFPTLKKRLWEGKRKIFIASPASPQDRKKGGKASSEGNAKKLVKKDAQLSWCGGPCDG